MNYSKNLTKYLTCFLLAFILNLLNLQAQQYIPKQKQIIEIGKLKIKKYDKVKRQIEFNIPITTIKDGVAKLKISSKKFNLEYKDKKSKDKIEEEIYLKKNQNTDLNFSLETENKDNILLSIFYEVPNAPVGYKKEYVRSYKIIKIDGKYTILNPREKTDLKPKQIDIIKGNSTLKKTNTIMTNYSVNVSGQITVDIRNEGLYGNGVALYFRNSSNPGSWYHPIYPGYNQHVHYDILDEQGNFNFNFSFSGDLSNYNEVIVIVSTDNSATYLPAPADGYNVWENNGYTTYFNESEGMIAQINPSSSTIIVNQNGEVNFEDGSILRYMMLSRDYAINLYGGSLPFTINPISSRVANIDPAGHFVIAWTPTGYTHYIEINPDNTEFTTVSHEYGHYVNFCMWGRPKFTDAGSDIKEGWAIFYSYGTRNNANKLYGDPLRDWDDNTETAPFRTPIRYNNIRYAQHGDPYKAAISCYLWSIYDNYNGGNLEASLYDIGDNDDISGYSTEVFETMRTLSNTSIASFHSSFITELNSDEITSANTINNFMFYNLYSIPSFEMKTSQVTSLNKQIVNNGQVVFSWVPQNYAGVQNYGNYEDGYKLYYLNGSTWDLVSTIPYGSNSYTHNSTDINNTYKITSYNSSGNSVNAPQTTISGIIPTLITSNLTLSSAHIVQTDITISNGVTLTIEPGASITFQNGASLIVNGTLDINGTLSNKVTFDFQSQNSTLKNGVKINTSGTADIDNAIIKNAYNGIYVDEAVVNIDNSEIFDCYYGIHLYRTNYVSYPDSYIENTHSHDNEFGVVMYYSTAHLSNNEFNNNWRGVGCADYSSPFLAPNDNNSESNGYNYIHNNDIGVFAYGYSNPFLGRETCVSFGGNNTIVNNNDYEFFTYSNCNVYAENNYWGGGAPVRYVQSGCSFDYTPYLTSAPQMSQTVASSPEEETFDLQFNQQLSKSNNSTNVLELVNSDKPKGFDENWSIEWKLLYARNLIRVKKYNSASKICEDVITDYPDSSLSYLALDLLHQSRIKDKNKTSFAQFVKEKSKKKVKKQIYGVAELVLAVGEKKDRIAVLDGISNKYEDSPLIEFVLFQKFMYYLYEENNLELAKTTSEELEKLFPKSESYFDSQRHLGNNVRIPLEPQLVKNVINEEPTVTPMTYELLGNYPNPFNPSTTISYALPYNSNIELTIYDITGKVVKVFGEQVQSAGYQNIVWHGKNQQGSRVSSGVYFYRFKATSLENENIFEQTAKMLLIK